MGKDGTDTNVIDNNVLYEDAMDKDETEIHSKIVNKWN